MEAFLGKSLEIHVGFERRFNFHRPRRNTRFGSAEIVKVPD